MTPTRLLVFFVLPLMLIHGTISVTVTTSNPKMEVHENTNAVLSCKFQTEKETNPRIEWKKKGQDISYVYFGGEFTGLFKGRASIDGATVTLLGVTQKDSGVYHCEVTASQDKISLGEVTVSLNVLVPLHAPSCHMPAIAMSGSVVELHCEYRHTVPPVTYSWYKDNRPLSIAHVPDINYIIDNKTGILKFTSLSISDAGRYRCEASDGIEPPKSCVGQHMNVAEFELNLTLVIAVGVGAALLLLSCSLTVFLCCQRGYCYKERKRGKCKRNMANYSPPADPKHYKHTESFVI
ncbi:junctional adhesion molecule 2b [Neoarius graeffei]|uniref:junctional adhesion molecule 2b n=1 Tax=Neoarius graeffei TaxID=443677 RepID=UPI00298BDDFA|nr:junctional adhesion molecule 2b [Neoarius graeffei]